MIVKVQADNKKDKQIQAEYEEISRFKTEQASKKKIIDNIFFLWKEIGRIPLFPLEPEFGIMVVPLSDRD